MNFVTEDDFYWMPLYKEKLLGGDETRQGDSHSHSILQSRKFHRTKNDKKTKQKKPRDGYHDKT